MTIVGPSVLGLIFFVATIALWWAPSARATDYSYTGVTGNWGTASNWTPGTAFPNAVGDTARFSQNVARTTTQDVAGGVTVGTITLSGSGNGNWTLTLSNPITLNQDGSGAASATISNTSTKSNILSLSAGTLTLADDLSIINSGASTAASGSIQIASTIGGTGNITINNTSNNISVAQIVLSGANIYVGSTLIGSGAVSFNKNTAFGAASNTVTLGQTGGSSVTLESSSTVTGQITNNITVSAVGSGNTATLGSASTAASGTTNYSGAITLNGDVNLTSSNAPGGTVQLSNTISGAGGLIKVGTGVAVLSGSSNSYAGGTTINDGTLRLSGAGTLGSTSGTLTINGGTLDLNGTNQGVGALNGTGGTVSNSTGSSTLTVGNGDATGSYGGSVSNIGSIALTKVGAGTQSLTANNSYTGQTTVSAGTLRLARTGGVALAGGGAVVVNRGGTLLMGANNQINQAVLPPITLGGATGSGTAKLDAGGFSQGTGGTPAVPNSGSIGLGALTLGSSSIIDLTGTSVLHFSKSSANGWAGTLSIYDWTGVPLTGGGSEQILFGGDVNGLSPTQLTQISFYSDQGTTLLSNTALILADGEIIPGVLIPEPGTWFAAALALGGVGFSQRKRLGRLLRAAV